MSRRSTRRWRARYALQRGARGDRRMHRIERARVAIWGVLVACVSLVVMAPAAAAETVDDAATPEYLDIPVVLIETGGSFLPATYISVNGSDPIFVSVDTGTSGLVLDPGAIQNPATPVV